MNPPTLSTPSLHEQCQKPQFSNPRSQSLAKISQIFHMILLQIPILDGKNPCGKPRWGKSPPNLKIRLLYGNKGRCFQTKVTSLWGDCNKGMLLLQQRGRFKKKKGLLMVEARSLWRLGLGNRRHSLFMFNHGMRRSKTGLQTATYSRGIFQIEENGEKISSSLWTRLERRKLVKFIRLSHSSSSLAYFELLDVIYGCWCFDYKLNLNISFLPRRQIVAMENLLKEELENTNSIGHPEPIPTMVDETLKGSDANNPFEDGHFGTEKDKGKIEARIEIAFFERLLGIMKNIIHIKEIFLYDVVTDNPIEHLKTLEYQEHVLCNINARTLGVGCRNWIRKMRKKSIRTCIVLVKMDNEAFCKRLSLNFCPVMNCISLDTNEKVEGLTTSRIDVPPLSSHNSGLIMNFWLFRLEMKHDVYGRTLLVYKSSKFDDCNKPKCRLLHSFNTHKFYRIDCQLSMGNFLLFCYLACRNITKKIGEAQGENWRNENKKSYKQGINYEPHELHGLLNLPWSSAAPWLQNSQLGS